jgi:transposase-like protein
MNLPNKIDWLAEIKKEMNEKRITVSEMARRVGISHQLMRYWFMKPTYERLEEMHNALKK